MKALRRRAVAPHLAALGLVCLPRLGAGAEALAIPDLARIADDGAWRVINGEVQAAQEGGRTVVRLAPVGGNRQGSNLALALVRGVPFAQGRIEVDLRGNPAGQGSFVGVAFGVVDGTTHEAIYFRPFNFQAGDPVKRSHAVQYVAQPQHPWDRLRAEKPGVYEAVVAPEPDPLAWFHARIDVTASRVSVFVDGAAQPCLAVDRLGRKAIGAVGLWVDSQPGSFANLTIQPRD